uniref:Vesicle transport protein n=1 Tax=Poecilia reticulata TaxID=8081 RepID=A0A3P9P4U0_POERE
MDKLKQVLGGQDGGGGSSDGSGILERANQASTLAWGTRMKGFLICFILGAVCSILATCLLWIPGFGLPVFAVLYTVGNLCALASTMFLIGPLRQLKNMCAKVRALATTIMLVCLVLTLCAAFWVRIGLCEKTSWFCCWLLELCGSGSAVEEQRLGAAVLCAAVSGLHLVKHTPEHTHTQVPASPV